MHAARCQDAQWLQALCTAGGFDSVQRPTYGVADNAHILRVLAVAAAGVAAPVQGGFVAPAGHVIHNDGQIRGPACVGTSLDLAACEAQMAAHQLRGLIAEAIIAHCAPGGIALDLNLQAALAAAAAVDQPQLGGVGGRGDLRCMAAAGITQGWLGLSGRVADGGLQQWAAVSSRCVHGQHRWWAVGEVLMQCIHLCRVTIA